MKGWKDGRAALLLWVILLLPWARGSRTPICDQRPDGYYGKQALSEITGGEPADIADFPWQSLRVYKVPLQCCKKLTLIWLIGICALSLCLQSPPTCCVLQRMERTPASTHLEF
ncbi:serine protease 52-like isoform X2 [Tupaia chinensis]|uniref:serine protease 52-like isoform X2 n=1 Tax=Tupaia chinensis TaxID=246437 RepID=UPI000FFBC0F6|nr:serine protease 52-like isoform X2 [Tupaia chinensis]